MIVLLPLLFLLFSTYLIAPTLSNEVSIRLFPTPIASCYSRLEFFPLQQMDIFSGFSLILESENQRYPFFDPLYPRFPGVFVESISPRSSGNSPSVRCSMFHPDDINRISPTPAGDLYIPETSRFEAKFTAYALIPANHIVSCFVGLLDNVRPSLQLKTFPLTLKHPVPVPVADHNPYSDPHSFVELSLHYRAGEGILAGERIDTLEFTVEALPSNVILPISIGLDSATETTVDRVYYLSTKDTAFIANLWSSLKPGKYDPKLTPEDPAFYQQSYDIPSPLCAHDVRLVYSRTKLRFFLVTGDKPAFTALCKIPLPIHYIHKSLAITSHQRQNLNHWCGTRIITYLQLNGRLFKQNSSSNSPTWWFYNNPHLTRYSTLISDSYLEDNRLPPHLVHFDYQLIFIGELPSITFQKLFTDKRYNIQRFFTPPTTDNEPADTRGFLNRFAYVTSPSDIRFPERHTPLALNMTDPFSTQYTFDDVFNGYLCVLISFSIPRTLFSPFSLHVMSRTGKVLKLAQAPDLFVDAALTHVSDTSTTSVITISHQSFSPRLPQTTLKSGLVRDLEIFYTNYYMFPVAMELVFLPFTYEYRPVDGLLPTSCKVYYTDMADEPYTPFSPTIRMERIPVLKDFGPDLSSFIAIENLELDIGRKIAIQCENPVDPNVLKPPFPPFAQFVRLSVDYDNYSSVISPFTSPVKPQKAPADWGTWTTLPPQTRTFFANLFSVTSPTPVNSEADFEELLEMAITIFDRATYIPDQSHVPSPSLFRGCIKRDSFYQSIISASNLDDISSTYHAYQYYPMSFATNGWDTVTDSITPPDPDWRDSFSIDSLTIHPNGAFITFALDATDCPPAARHSSSLQRHTFNSYLGVIIQVMDNHSLINNHELPRLQYQGRSDNNLNAKDGNNNNNNNNINNNNNNSGDKNMNNNTNIFDDDDQDPSALPVGKKGGGMRCITHYDCTPYYEPSRYQVFSTCYRGYCTTPVQSLTPFELRLFHTLFANLYSKSLISIDTSHDYTPISEQLSTPKLVFFILAPFLAVGLLLLIFEATKSFKCCSSKPRTDLEDNLIDSDGESDEE